MYVNLIMDCVNCGDKVCVHPLHVPSIRVYPEGGPEEGEGAPLCEECFDRWNEIHRTSQGLPAIPLHPKACGPFPESELPSVGSWINTDI